MHFGLSEDQAAIRDSVRGFARAKLAPGYLERAKSDQFPWDAHREIAGLGVFGLLAGEQFNPLPGEDFVAAGLAVEELRVRGLQPGQRGHPGAADDRAHRPARP